MNMRNKMISLLLCVLLLINLATPVLAEEAPQILTITSRSEFLAFAESCRLDSYSQGLTVALQTDIDLTGSSFGGIPTFSGTFLGNDHTVSGLALTDAGSVQGLFRYLTATALVQDLKVNGSVSPQGSKDAVGGIAGENAGSIVNCTFKGQISGSESVGGIAGINTVTGIIQDCRTEGVLHGEHFVGGMAGENNGVIRTCTNFMEVNTTPQQNSIALEQITLSTITNAESAGTVTDIGGIAGHSAGVLRNCVNYGSVGYPHMGYNIGGIAGSQMGYITGCVNHGTVSGRKEVGGIVGQMEPATNIVFTEDALQILQGQLDTLGSLTKTASGHVQGSASSINQQITSIQDQAEAAKDAVDQLIPDQDNPTLPDADRIQAAQNVLSSSLSGMQNSLDKISTSLKGTVSTLQKDMQAISHQVDAMGQTVGGASENLGVTLTDISDLDTPEDTAGKVENCANYAEVLADLSAGGIAGAICLENDLDPEEDVQIFGDYSLNFSSELRAVILNCRNSAAVTCGKQNAGGIIGWISMGLVKDCLNSGSVEAEGADYVGGIAGQSAGFIRSCSVKAFLSGDTNVGGIAGTAEVISDCRSMTSLTATEKQGGIAGSADTLEEIKNNYYLSADADPGAVDSISYDGCAQSLDADAFLALEGLDPLFGRITVMFRFPDGVVDPVFLDYGQALSPEDVPVIPEKEGDMAYWEGLHYDALHFDTSFTGVYDSHITTLQSQQTQTGKPVLLVQGSFTPEDTVALTQAQYTPQVQKNAALLATGSFTVSGSAGPVTARYRLPEGCDADAVQVLVRDESGSWQVADSHVEDSYVVFPAAAGDNHMALIQENTFPWLYVAIGAGAVLLMILLMVSLRKKRKNTPAPPTE